MRYQYTIFKMYFQFLYPLGPNGEGAFALPHDLVQLSQWTPTGPCLEKPMFAWFMQL